jgi:putative N6-adenine-specific DNA methylase
VRSERIFAACAPGLEPVLANELVALGLDARPVRGGVEATGPDAVAVACIGARTADSVVLRLFVGPERELDRALADARRRTRGARLAVRRQDGLASVSLDAVGGALYRRGYRERIGAAPLRESVAAAMLLLAGYDGSAPLLDPMCGSGTIAIEAALIAARRSPGLRRRFAFESWPWTEAARTAAVRARFAARERGPPAPILASDRNAGVLRLAARNAAAAGVETVVKLRREDAARLEARPGPGLVAVNPPFGVRLSEDVEGAWGALAALLARLPAWRAAILAPDRGLERLLARPATRAVRIRPGGLPCRVLLLGA